jgi:hypothetical protein
MPIISELNLGLRVDELKLRFQGYFGFDKDQRRLFLNCKKITLINMKYYSKIGYNTTHSRL